MELRRKFSIIALIYLASLVGSLVLAAWCILVYFESAFAGFDAELGRERLIEDLRTTLRWQADLLEAPTAEMAKGYEQLEDRFDAGLERLAESSGVAVSSWPAISEAERTKDDVARRRFEAMSRGQAGPLQANERAAFIELDTALGELRAYVNEARQQQVDRAAATESRVISILAGSALFGGFLCVLGLLSLRRWIARPIAELRHATRLIAAGHFDYRVPVNSQDELGRLAAEVNQMCSTIQDMQRRLIEQERLAAAGEMFARLAHNIRNPLGSIRGLAEATVQQRADDAQTVECQRRIISTVDRFEKWLRDMQQSVSPMSLNLQPVAIREPIDSVTTALGPLFDRRGVGLEVEIDPRVDQVLLDAGHFEQGLAAIVTNAIQASAAGQRVRIEVSPADPPDGRWQITVADEGPGVPPEIRDKIFLPCFTTKPDGHGLGLAMANKVVKIHGGDLTFQSLPGRGTRFVALFPGMLREPE